jgi:hypothetical protein
LLDIIARIITFFVASLVLCASIALIGYLWPGKSVLNLWDPEHAGTCRDMSISRRDCKITVSGKVIDVSFYADHAEGAPRYAEEDVTIRTDSGEQATTTTIADLEPRLIRGERVVVQLRRLPPFLKDILLVIGISFILIITCIRLYLVWCVFRSRRR